VLLTVTWLFFLLLFIQKILHTGKQTNAVVRIRRSPRFGRNALTFSSNVRPFVRSFVCVCAFFLFLLLLLLLLLLRFSLFSSSVPPPPREREDIFCSRIRVGNPKIFCFQKWKKRIAKKRKELFQNLFLARAKIVLSLAHTHRAITTTTIWRTRWNTPPSI